MSHRILFSVLLAVSLGTLCLGLILRRWSCGNLFSSCQFLWGSSALLVAAFLCLAALTVAVALILQLILFCAPYLEGDSRYNISRFVILGVGVCSFVIALVYYTARMDSHWSYMFSVIAAVIATQVLITQLVYTQRGYVDTIR